MAADLGKPEIDDDRVLGRLALSENEVAISVLVAQLASREVVFQRNIEDPVRVAGTLFQMAALSQDLGTEPPMLIRIEGQTESNPYRFKVISSDGNYMLYAEVERS